MLDGLTKCLKIRRVTEDVGWTNEMSQNKKSDRRCWMD